MKQTLEKSFSVLCT